MLKETVDLLRDKKKIILVHGNADMDAVGSAYALSICFPPADICAFGGMDRIASLVSEKIGIPVLEDCNLEDYDSVVVVDTSSPEQAGLKDVTIPEGSVVIDHHLPTNKWTDMHFLCDDSKVSCCELVKELIDNAGVKIEKNVALALLSGIITDSGHFQFAVPDTLKCFAELLEVSDVHMDEVLQLTKSQTGMSERIAVMKALGRVKYDHVGNMIVATSYGGSFESSSSRAVMLSGADVVFVGSQRDEEFRLSARATQDIVRRGIHLGDIMGSLGFETDSDGGGHGGAAGLSGTGDVEAMLHMCMIYTMDVFRKIRENESRS
jgi:Exopolyphosphatase-related proteins